MRSSKITRIQQLVALFLLICIGIMMRYTASLDVNSSYINVLSYFTIQSNAIVVGFFLGLRSIFFSGEKKPTYRYELVRGALTLYMSITVIIYWTLLHHLIKIPFGLEYFANIFLHSMAWLILMADFWAFPPQHQLNWQMILYWLSYPLLYSIFTMLRGWQTNWYPYPFMNPENTGSDIKTFIIFIAMGLVFFAFGLAVIKFHNRCLKSA
ncbi:MAG: Pr6Pr family membrane protein [Oligoflexus sp.]